MTLNCSLSAACPAHLTLGRVSNEVGKLVGVAVQCLKPMCVLWTATVLLETQTTLPWIQQSFPSESASFVAMWGLCLPLHSLLLVPLLFLRMCGCPQDFYHPCYPDFPKGEDFLLWSVNYSSTQPPCNKWLPLAMSDCWGWADIPCTPALSF